MLLLKLLISLETSLGCLISEVNLFQPSLLAVIIAFLYSLLSEVYKSLPAGVLFLASFLHLECIMVCFLSHQDGYLNLYLQRKIGIVLDKVALRIDKNSFNLSSIEVAVQYLALDHFSKLQSSSLLNRPQLPLR